MVKNQIFKIQIIGIANSVEMFKGDLKQEFAKKIVFDPYTRQELAVILFKLMKTQFDKFPYFSKVIKGPKNDTILQFIDKNALNICATNVDKLSGDLRVCFSIMKNTVQ